MATDPKARAREAFSDLDTPEKTAFVIEATFSTIGSALRETGERLGSIITEFDPDDFFRSPERPSPEAEPTPKAKTAAAKKPAATRASGAAKTTGKKATGTAKPPGAKKAKPSGTKTAGRARKKKSDDDA
jgi:hypothetical protein